MTSSAALFYLVSTMKRVCFDYNAQWKRGTPSNYIDSVTFPKVLTDKNYSYRVVINGQDHGVKPAYEVQGDGSQTVNLLEYNKGYGVGQGSHIQVYAVDPTDGNQYLVGEWKN